MAETDSRDKKPTQGTRLGPLRMLSSLEAGSFGRLTSVMNVIGGIWIVFLVLLVVGDVVGREAFNNPIPATKEMVQLSIPGIVFLQLANTLRTGRHISSDMLIGLAQRKWPRISVAIFGVFNLFGVAIMGMIAILITPKTIQAYEQGFEKGTQGIFTLPEWPVMALVILGSAVMAVQYFFLALRDFHAAATGNIPRSTPSSEPVGE